MKLGGGGGSQMDRHKNVSGLETIFEKAKEEDRAMSISNMQKIDPEESYSFSLRNFQSKSNHNSRGGRAS
jgi:hypothetical protein